MLTCSQEDKSIVTFAEYDNVRLVMSKNDYCFLAHKNQLLPMVN